MLDGRCMASLANSPRGAYVDMDINRFICIIIIIICIIIIRPAKSNCTLCVSGATISLEATNKIKAGSEIIWFYSNGYKYPPNFD